MIEASLAGKLVVITGGASGIGRATAESLAGLGANLELFDVSPNLDSVLAQCRQISGPYHCNATNLDVSDFNACEKAFRSSLQGRRVDHVFNCAGVNPTPTELTETSNEHFDKLFSVNMKGIYNVTKLLIPHMNTRPFSDRHTSSFINVGSICGLHPMRNMAIYCATKYAVTGFSKSLALELGPKGIRVNVVAPGFIHTPTNSSVLAGQEAIDESSQQVAMGRLGDALEVANVVVFLMSDRAGYMNGSVVEVNGGTG